MELQSSPNIIILIQHKDLGFKFKLPDSNMVTQPKACDRDNLVDDKLITNHIFILRTSNHSPPDHNIFHLSSEAAEPNWP
jgi:hypothetical protein